ncbi:MAG: hypothetical protein KGZ80_02030 [Methylomonas sp.]|nr:hypothetical protein [Methylomonas sp.]
MLRPIDSNFSEASLAEYGNDLSLYRHVIEKLNGGTSITLLLEAMCEGIERIHSGLKCKFQLSGKESENEKCAILAGLATCDGSTSELRYLPE